MALDDVKISLTPKLVPKGNSWLGGDKDKLGDKAGPEDGFAAYTFFGYDRPRWGDYSAAAVDGQTVWVASEYIANSGTVGQFQADLTLGGTRAFFSNWDNRITPVAT